MLKNRGGRIILSTVTSVLTVILLVNLMKLELFVKDATKFAFIILITFAICDLFFVFIVDGKPNPSPTSAKIRFFLYKMFVSSICSLRLLP